MLCKVVKALTAKEMTLESSERTVSDLTASLQEKERAIKATNVEIMKPRIRVGLKLQELQHLKNDGDHLRNTWTRHEALSFRWQKRTSSLQVEKAQLEKEINNRRLELQELKILKYKMDAKIQELGLRGSKPQRSDIRLMPFRARYLFLEEAMTNANKERHFLKEEKKLQGPVYTSNSSLKPHVLPSSPAHSHSNIPSSQATASFTSHHSMKSNTLRENPTRDLKQLLQELSSGVNEDRPVPLGKTEEDGKTPPLGVSHVAEWINRVSCGIQLSDPTSLNLFYSPSHLHAANQRLRRAHVQSAGAPSPSGNRTRRERRRSLGALNAGHLKTV
ncbi:hypothetical protein MC885_018456 [Smutsia gigantea]|nr:hypothetical protein MC885_018456 [Smutsia gigantea]